MPWHIMGVIVVAYLVGMLVLEYFDGNSLFHQ